MRTRRKMERSRESFGTYENGKGRCPATARGHLLLGPLRAAKKQAGKLGVAVCVVWWGEWMKCVSLSCT